MKNKLVIISLILIVLLVSLFTLYRIGKVQVNSGKFISRMSTKIFDYNSLILNCSDKEMLDGLVIYHNKNCIYKEGVYKQRIRNDYGLNSFKVYFKDKKYSELTFFKKNNWHVNKYVFDFSVCDDEVLVTLSIIGPDSNEEISNRN